ncbi:hypothetical protein [Marinobacterium jannaschii]|uniref:hypothetical protein n=1 Tax=Marinobacterium jannaschii TaxID=64970 RepID=UPI000485C1ED|nr:hypothetical protein [Marinobacterium jannaschii]
MRDVKIIQAILGHAEHIAAHMRIADINEIWAASLSTPEESLIKGIKRSTPAMTGLVDGRPVAMFGVAPMSVMTGVGAPWLLGTDEVDQVSLSFLKHSRAMVTQWKQDHALLYNYVDARNAASIRWLKWLGFTIQEARPYGALQLPFHRFEFVRDDYV